MEYLYLLIDLFRAFCFSILGLPLLIGFTYYFINRKKGEAYYEDGPFFLFLIFGIGLLYVTLYYNGIERSITILKYDIVKFIIITIITIYIVSWFGIISYILYTLDKEEITFNTHKGIKILLLSLTCLQFYLLIYFNDNDSINKFILDVFHIVY